MQKRATREELIEFLMNMLPQKEKKITKSFKNSKKKASKQTPQQRDKPYFWSLEERVEFIKLLHKYGKRWI